MYTPWPYSEYNAIGGALMRSGVPVRTQKSGAKKSGAKKSSKRKAYTKTPFEISQQDYLPLTRRKHIPDDDDEPPFVMRDKTRRSPKPAFCRHSDSSVRSRCKKDTKIQAHQDGCTLGDKNYCVLSERKPRSKKSHSKSRYVSPKYCSLDVDKTFLCKRDKNATEMDSRCKLSKPKGKKMLRYCAKR